MRIGKLVEMLGGHDGGAPVFVEVAGVEREVTGLSSYRGFYDHLAIVYDDERGRWRDARPLATVGVLRDALAAAIGQSFEGWKGGDYVMRGDTPVWAAPRGDATSQQPCEVVARGGRVIVRAFEVDTW